MSETFPPELVDSILSYLCGTPSIRECALVCNAWVASARRHLLPHPRILNLDHIQIVNFLALADSPHSTFSFLLVNTLHLSQNLEHMDLQAPYTPPRINVWRADTTISNFFERNPKPNFLGIKALILEWIDCKTLSPDALVALNTNYTSLKSLSLKWITITFPELCSIITNLPGLETLIIGEGTPFAADPWSVQHPAPSLLERNHPAVQKLTHKTLTRLIFDFRPPLWMIQHMCRGFHYAAGIVEVSIDQYLTGKWWEFQESCVEVFSMAGTSLQTVKLRTRASHHWAWAVSVNQMSSIALFLSFPHNPNLREIHLRDVTEGVLGGFIRGLKSNPKPHLRTLKLGLAQIEFLTMEEWKNTWELVDHTLSSKSSLALAGIASSSGSQATVPVKNHQIILECSSYRKIGFYSGLAGAKPVVSEINPEDVLHTAMGVLPRMTERWSIKVEMRM